MTGPPTACRRNAKPLFTMLGNSRASAPANQSRSKRASCSVIVLIHKPVASSLLRPLTIHVWSSPFARSLAPPTVVAAWLQNSSHQLLQFPFFPSSPFLFTQQAQPLPNSPDPDRTQVPITNFVTSHLLTVCLAVLSSLYRLHRPQQSGKPVVQPGQVQPYPPLT